MIESLQIELRKGLIVLAVLSRLKQSEYGYELSKSLESSGFSVETNTLYPLLRRLEKQGLLESEWSTEQSSPRKYYRTTPLGQEIYLQLSSYWKEVSTSLNLLLEEEHEQ